MKRTLFALALASLVLVHCGDDDDGAAGTAASSGVSGAAGVAGESGVAGSTGTSGAGAAGVSASAGASGAGASGAGGAGASGSSAGDAGTSGAAGGGCTVDGTTHMGDGTYYDADGSGNCSFDASPGDLMVGAMNHTDYAASAVCGSCVALTGPTGSITIRIVDQCPECMPGDIDLSPQAFEKISPLSAGRVDISWSYVACELSGPISYHFKEGSNPYWSAVQIRNHRYAITKVEGMKDGAYVDMPRADYNFFILDGGLGNGPYSFRVTDVKGQVLEDTGIPFVEAGDSSGSAQFPACP